MIDFTQLLVGGIPLLVVIFGLVEFIKSFGLKGNWLTALLCFSALPSASPIRSQRAAYHPASLAGL